MEEKLGERLYSAIEKDDLRAFDEIAKSVKCGELRLGRFPVLSALYLCNAKKIFSAHEDEYIKCTAWKELPEPADLSARFMKVAGKCLRLYFSDVVTPAEMLMLCGDEKRLKRLYPRCRATASSRQKLKTIYQIKYSAEVAFEGDDIILARKGLGKRGKTIIIAACAAFAVCAAIGASTPFIVNEFRPFISAGKTEDGRDIYEVSRASAIDFGSDKVYRLKKNITLSSSFREESVTCTILGNGKTVTVKGGSSPFGTLYGEMSGLNFKTNGAAPLFDEIYASGNLNDVTVNAAADCTLADHSAFVTRLNYGIIENVEVNADGYLGFAYSDISEEDDGLVFGAIAAENGFLRINVLQSAYGYISNCTVNFSDFTVSGESTANATLAGVAGLNTGYIEGCTVTGAVTSSQVDLAGVCVRNYYAVTSCENAASLTQISDSDSWNPLVAGIAMTNAYVIAACQNTGKLTARSTVVQTSQESLPTAAAAGIAYNNSYSVQDCRNSGDIVCEGNASVYAGGLCALSFYETVNGYSCGKIEAGGETCYVGGIVGRSRPDITSSGNIFLDNTLRCVCESEIVVSSSSASYVGGIVGYVEERTFFADTENERTLGGGISYSYFTGRITASDNDACGGIAGASGATIYTENSYNIGTTTYYNFGSNFYGNECGAAVGTGATVTVGENDEHVLGEGGDTGATSAPAAEIKSRAEYANIVAASEKTD